MISETKFAGTTASLIYEDCKDDTNLDYNLKSSGNKKNR